VFPGGTITLSHRASGRTSKVDPQACLNLVSQVGC
jgi:hypothetical protein